MKITIIGAGISGLVTALNLHKYGFGVEIYESANQIASLGLGINLQPHATKVLAELGLLDDLAGSSVSIFNLQFRCDKNIHIFSEKRGINAGYKYPQLAIHRGKLQEILLKHVNQRIGSDNIHLSHKLDHFQEIDNCIKINFKNRISNLSNTVVSCLLIGADGINSTVRDIIHKDKSRYHFEGIMLWRGVTKSKAFADFRTIFVCGNFHVQLVIYPITNPDENGYCYINWVVEVLDENARMLPENCWNERGYVDEFIHYFKDWKFNDPDIFELFYKAEKILKFPMVDRNPLSFWGLNRTTLIGDAAHPMYPRGANGASQAIVDAKILAEYIKLCPNITQALKKYEQERIRVTSKVVLNNRRRNQVEILSLVEDTCNTLCKTEHVCVDRNQIESILEDYKYHANASIRQVNEKV